MKVMLLGATAALALATGAFADVTTTGSYLGSATELGATNTYTGNPVNAYGFYTGLVGSAVAEGGDKISFSDGAVAASSGSVSSPTSATSTTTISQLVTNTTGAAKDVTFSSILSGGSFGLFSADTCEGGQAGCPSFLGASGHDLPALGTETSGFNVDVLVDGVTAYSLSGEVTLVNGVLTPEITQAKNFLNAFSSIEVDNRTGVLQQFYEWNDTALDVDLGDLAAGASFNVAYNLTTFATNATNSDLQAGQGQIGYSSFGDPLGGGHTINNINIPTFTVNTPEILFAPISGGAPEPSAWMLMIVGIGLAGASLRSRRSVVGRSAVAA